MFIFVKMNALSSTETQLASSASYLSKSPKLGQNNHDDGLCKLLETNEE